MKQDKALDAVHGGHTGRRVFLRNLSALGASVPAAALMAEAAAGTEPQRLAQAEAPAPKPKPKVQVTAVTEKGDFSTLQEIVVAAKRNLPPDLWTHLTGGSDSETTIRRNRMAFETLALRQHLLLARPRSPPPG